MPKNPFRSKKTGRASSSKQTEPSKKQKKRRVETESEESDYDSDELVREIEEEERQREENLYSHDEHPMNVDWKSGTLSEQDLNHQLRLFKEKYANERVIRDNLCCERKVAKRDFHGIHLEEKFAALGWEAVLDYNDGGSEMIYYDAILNWMGTLVRENGRNPPRTTRLVGEVNGTKVVMSFQSLRQLAPFDSRPDGDYLYVSEDDYWNHPAHIGDYHRMLATILDPHKEAALVRNNMKLEPRLLLSLMLTNVTPRLGDKSSVRMHEVMVLYAIMTGEIVLSFRHMIMMHVWQARETKGKKLIPHCRLINAMLKRAGVVDPTDPKMKKKQQHFKLTELKHESWEYKETSRWHKLKMGTDKFRMLKYGQQLPQPGEVDDSDSSADGDAGAPDQPEPGQPGPGETGYSWGVFDAEMQGIVQSARPPEYGDWPSMNRALYDQNTRHSETHSRELRELRENQNRIAATQMFNQEHEVNMRYFDRQQERMFHDWEAGRPVERYPPYVDYTQHAPYDGSIRHPSPQPHHSMWVDPAHSWQYYQSSQGYPHPPQSQQQQQGSGGEGSSGAMDFASSWLSQMGDWFSGGPGPAYH